MRNVEAVEKYIFYSMCGFFFTNAVSVAAGNVFMVISFVLALYRVWLKNDDILERFEVGIKWLVPLGVFLLIVLLSCLASGDVGFCVKSFFNYYVFRALGFLVIMIACHDKDRLIKMALVGLAAVAINGGMTLYSWVVLHQRTGGFLPTMSMAGILSMFVPVLVSGALLLKRRMRWMVGGAALFLMAVAVANGTRGAWMAIVLTAFFAVCCVLDSWKKRISVVLVCVALVGGSVVSGGYLGKRVETIFTAADQSSRERFYLWQSAYNMFEDNKVLGVGLQRFGKLYPTKYILPEAKYRELGHAHSNIFQVLAECGGLGLLAVFVLWGRMLLFGVGGWFRTKQFAYLAMFCVVSGLLIQGLTEYSWGNAVVMKYFWCSLAICMQLINIDGNI